MAGKKRLLKDALKILIEIGMPSAQINDRTAICLLALLDLYKGKNWPDATNPLLGIRAILDFARSRMKVNYAENTRESIRKYSVKQLVAAGVVKLNSDDPKRSTNSSKNSYKVDELALSLFKVFGTNSWQGELNKYLKVRPSLAAKYTKERNMQMLDVKLKNGSEIQLSPGAHSELIKAIIEEFGSRYLPGGELVYVGDTGSKWGYFDKKLLLEIGVEVEKHGKMPDVIIFYREKNWLILAEAVTSGGPIDGIRHIELLERFKNSKAGLIFVTAFPDRGKIMRKFLSEVSWETEVWAMDTPDHIIHFDGLKFLGPYKK